tara:strand:- start:1481 stop:2338 length:858 start_codon:yes stop_codon:yes gene_type:complete
MMRSPAAVVIPFEGEAPSRDQGGDAVYSESTTARPHSHGAFHVLGVPFVSGGACLTGGDFEVMIDQEYYQDTLFIFNGNVEDDWAEIPVAGAGSAVIRPLSAAWEGCRCVGIPTGWASATPFRELNGLTKMAIDMSVHRILDVVEGYDYARVVFSCAANDKDRVGTQTFSVPEHVVEYISQRLIALPALARADYRLSTEHARLQVRMYLKETIETHKKQWQLERISATRATASMGDGRQLTQFPIRPSVPGLTQLRQTTMAGNEVVGHKRPFSKPLVMTMGSTGL